MAILVQSLVLCGSFLDVVLKESFFFLLFLVFFFYNLILVSSFDTNGENEDLLIVRCGC